MKLTSEQLVPWFNHRVYPMVAWVLVGLFAGYLWNRDADETRTA